MNDGGFASQWQFPSLVDYYDFEQHVLVEQPARLTDLDDEDRSSALSIVQGAVVAHTTVLDGELLSEAAVSVIDDLYKAACAVTEWSSAHDDYVRAVWDTFFSVLASRGFAMRYIVENSWPDPIDRPIRLFPELFGAAGLVYVCPHQIATRLPEGAATEPTLDGLRFVLKEARIVAGQIVDELVAADPRPFVYLEIDFDEGCLDHLAALPNAPGTITVFRNEAPLPGTTVQASITPPTLSG